jgi:hypothetical protein
MASGLGREGRILKRRFDMILDQAPGHRLSRPLRAFLVATLAALVPLSPRIVAGEDDEADPERGGGKPTDTIEKHDPHADPTKPREGAGKEDWGHKTSSEEMEARLASLEKQVGALLEEIKKGRAAAEDTDLTSRESNYLKDKLAWKKRESNSSNGRSYRVEKNVLWAIDPRSSKELWVTKLPFSDFKFNVDDKVIHVTDGHHVLVIDAATGKIIEKGPYVQSEDSNGFGVYGKPRKLWKKNELPRVSESDDKVRPEKNHLPRVSEKISSIEDLKAEKLKLLERLAEIEALEQKLETLDKKPAK